MKFAAFIEYHRDQEKLQAVHPTHRQHLRALLESGRLLAAGPFTESGGALIVYKAASAGEVEGWIRADPYHAAGLITGWQVRPLAYWSAQAAGPGKKSAAAE